MPSSSRRRRCSIERYDDPDSSASDSSEPSSLDGKFALPRRQSRGRSGRHPEQSRRGSRSRGASVRVERSNGHDLHGPSGPYARLRTPPPTHQPDERRVEHAMEVDDSAARTSRSRRADNWWKRHVGRSRALTVIALLLIGVSRVESSRVEWSRARILRRLGGG